MKIAVTSTTVATVSLVVMITATRVIAMAIGVIAARFVVTLSMRRGVATPTVMFGGVTKSAVMVTR